MSRTRLRGWQILLIVGSAAVVVAGLVVGFYVLRFLANPFGDPDDFGYHQIDAQAAGKSMEYRKVGIPDGFAFEEMTVLRQFVGADSYWGRYRAPGDFASAQAAVAAANPSFPPMRAAGCADEVVQGFAEHPGLACTATMRLAVTTAYAGKADVIASDAYGTPSDGETLLLVDDGGSVALLVCSNGH